MAKRSIGEANIKITADGVDEVKRDLGDVKSELQDVASEGGGAFGALDGAARKATGTIKGATDGVAGLARSLTGVLGIVGALGTLFGTVFGVFIERIRRSREEAEELSQRIKSLGEDANRTADGFARIVERIGAASETPIDLINKQEEETINRILEDREKLIKSIRSPNLSGGSGAEQLNALREQNRKELEATKESVEAERLVRELAEKARVRIRRQELEDQQKEEAKAIEDTLERERRAAEETIALRDAIAARRLELLEGEEREVEQFRIRERQLLQQVQDAAEQGNTDRIAALREALELERQITQARIDGIRQRERERQEADESRKLAEELRKTQQALRDQQRATQEAARNFNDLQRTLDQLNREVKNFAGAASRIGDGVRRR